MFSAQAASPLGPECELRALWLSLNRPVVAIPELPAGPAAAAVVHGSGAAGERVVLALRSLRNGRVIFFAPEVGWSSRRPPGADAVLSFAESMGFLFDEEAECDPGLARRLWGEFRAESAPEAADPQRAPAAILSKFRLFRPRRGASVRAA